MVKSILVATDGSEHAAKALKLACDLATKYKAKVTIVHSLLSNASSETLRKLADSRSLTKEQRALLDNYEMEAQALFASSGEAIAYNIPAPIEILEAVGRHILDHAKAAAKKAGVSDVTTVLVGGEPANAILEAALKHKADMIVLGSRGLGGFKGLILGSVSHKVSARAKCTCVTIK